MNAQPMGGCIFGYVQCIGTIWMNLIAKYNRIEETLQTKTLKRFEVLVSIAGLKSSEHYSNQSTFCTSKRVKGINNAILRDWRSNQRKPKKINIGVVSLSWMWACWPSKVQSIVPFMNNLPLGGWAHDKWVQHLIISTFKGIDRLCLLSMFLCLGLGVLGLLWSFDLCVFFPCFITSRWWYVHIFKLIHGCWVLGHSYPNCAHHEGVDIPSFVYNCNVYLLI